MSDYILPIETMQKFLGDSVTFTDNGDGVVGAGDTVVHKTMDPDLNAITIPIQLAKEANTLEGIAAVIEGVTSRDTYVVVDNSDRSPASYLISEPLAGQADVIVAKWVTGWSTPLQIYRPNLKKDPIWMPHLMVQMQEYCRVKNGKVDESCASDFAYESVMFERAQGKVNSARDDLEAWQQQMAQIMVESDDFSAEDIKQYEYIISELMQNESAAAAQARKMEIKGQENLEKKK